MIDTHTHLYLEAFDQDRDAVVRRAFEAGVTQFFLPAIDSSHTDKMLDVKKTYPDHVSLMAGLHPCSVDEGWETEVVHAAHLLESSPEDYVAVGEIGIDLYWKRDTLPHQRDAFVAQIRLAKKHGLPIVIHCREAFDEIFEVLEAEKGGGLRGVFHCFTGSAEQARQAISYGLALGIGGVVTFKNGQIDKSLEKISPEYIVLETDAPFLAPEPYRGKRNESAYLIYVVQKLSAIYGLSEQDIIQQTYFNTMSIFKK